MFSRVLLVSALLLCAAVVWRASRSRGELVVTAPLETEKGAAVKVTVWR